jgi:transmembrane sensor
MTLFDGTRVWLNAGSTLGYNSSYGKSNRDVYLNGEAYFEVSKNKKLPFKVNTSAIRVTALGTVFNVKSYNDEGVIETTLEEGIVRIDPLKTSTAKNSIRPVILKPNQIAIYVKHNRVTHVTKITHQNPSVVAAPASQTEEFNPLPVKVAYISDIKLYTSWKGSRWIFKNEKFSSLAPKLERRYDVHIEFKDSLLRDYTFSGVLKEESIEQVLQAICLTSPVKFNIRSKSVILSIDNVYRNSYDKLLLH